VIEERNLQLFRIISVKRIMQLTMYGQVKVQNKLSESFHIQNGLRQGDALACILFNTALEKIIRDANINQRGNIFYK
jgi:hypothetical protein